MLKQISQRIGCRSPNIRVVIFLLQCDQAFVNASVIALALGAVERLDEISNTHAHPFSRDSG